MVSFVVIGGSGPGIADAAAQVMLGARTTLDKNTVKMTISGSLSSGGQTIPITGSGSADSLHDTESVTMSSSTTNYTAIAETFCCRTVHRRTNKSSRTVTIKSVALCAGKAMDPGPNRGTRAGGLGWERLEHSRLLQIFDSTGQLGRRDR